MPGSLSSLSEGDYLHNKKILICCPAAGLPEAVANSNNALQEIILFSPDTDVQMEMTNPKMFAAFQKTSQMPISKSHKMDSIFLNKKGQTWPLKEIVTMVLVVVIVLATFGYFEKVYAAFTGQKDSGPVANFNRLYNDMKELLESSAAPDYKLDQYDIGSGRILMGFDTNWNDQTKSVIGILNFFNAYKPFKCGNSACICLYASNWEPSDPAKRDTGIVSCRSEIFVNRDIAFLSEGSDVSPKTSGAERSDISGNYLVFYGDNWKVQEIYIEKFVSGSRTYFYISRIDTTNENDPANLRKKRIDYSKKAAN